MVRAAAPRSYTPHEVLTTAEDHQREWVRQRAEQDEVLYRQYGTALEAEHRGEFVAISDDGRTLIDADELSLTKRAVEEFGAGRFALRRIGHAAEVRWRGTA